MTDEKIARINALAKKSKTEGLTEAESRSSRRSARNISRISEKTSRVSSTTR